MLRHITKHETETLFLEAESTLATPHVALTVNDRKIHYIGYSDPYAGNEYVDLSLPSGTKWAKMNIGASSPTEQGSLFAWGETETKQTYDWSTYAYGNSTSSINKYTSADGKRVLEHSDDAVNVNMGGNWHIPTLEQLNELFNTSYVTRQWTTDYEGSGVKGMIFTSVADNTKSIFIPAQYNDGKFWTSSVKASGGYQNAYYLKLNSTASSPSDTNRCVGLVVRGVIG